MKRKTLSLGIMGAVAATTMAIAPSAAQAQYYGGSGYYQPVHWHHHHYRDGYYGRGYYDRGYYNRGYYGRSYYGRGGYYRCHSDGTGGAIIGAIAGGLLGNAVAGYGDRTAGTIIGGGLGALAGNAIASHDC